MASMATHNVFLKLTILSNVVLKFIDNMIIYILPTRLFFKYIFLKLTNERISFYI